MGLENVNNAVDFLLVLGSYYCQRIGEAWKNVTSGVNPWNPKAFVGGIAGLLYLLAVVAVFAVLLYDGFGRHSQRNSVFLLGIVVLFVLSFLK